MTKYFLLILVLHLLVENKSIASDFVPKNYRPKIENTAVMLRKLTYLYESMAKYWLQEISKPNQQITHVQELAYNIGFIKELLGYTNAIIDNINLE